MVPYTCIIVEDNQIDSLMTQAMVKRYPFLNLTGIFENAKAALDFMKDNEVHILLSDVEMEGMDGLELRRRAMNLPACIFITSYPEYAADSFMLSALDYIVKPLTGKRFDDAMQRLQDYLELRHKASLFDYAVGGQSIFIKEGSKQLKISLYEVQYLEALRDYTRLVTLQTKYCVLGTLHQMLEKEGFRSFVRIHRSYAVQKHFVRKTDAGHIYLDGDIILPLGRSFKEQVAQTLY